MFRLVRGIKFRKGFGGTLKIFRSALFAAAPKGSHRANSGNLPPSANGPLMAHLDEKAAMAFGR
jgi:hypothetical protein